MKEVANEDKISLVTVKLSANINHVLQNISMQKTVCMNFLKILANLEDHKYMVLVC